MRNRLLAAIAVLATAFIARAQSPCETAIQGMTTDITAAKNLKAADGVARAQDETIRRAIRDTFSLNNFATCVDERATKAATPAAASRLQATVAKDIEAKRVDVQSGAPASASGTTTAVASASKPNFLGLALENGAVSQAKSGTSTTISINPWKFVSSLAHDEKIQVDPGDPGSELLRRLAFSLTLNPGASQTTTQTSTASGAGTTAATLLTQLKQVSNFTAHFDIVNDRDPMSGKAARSIRDDVAKNFPAKQFFPSADAIALFAGADSLAETTVLQTFTGDIPRELNAFFDREYARVAASADITKAVATFNTAAATVIASNKKVYDKLAHSPTFSIEYSLDRQPMIQAMATAPATTSTTSAAPINPPDLHTGRLIHANRFIGSSEYTLTASASFFGQKTATMADRWRDLQFGAKIDIPFAGIANTVDKGTLTFSGLYVDLHQTPLGIDLQVNGVSVTQPGKIGLFQAKYTVPLGNGSGVQLPLSITYSNRSDLIKETSVQGSIGITFDWSKLVAAKQASGQ